jgi:hypothetical protein
LSRSIAAIASSTVVPIFGRGALALRCDQRASFGNPEDVLGAVLVRVFRVGAFRPLSVELGVLRLERVGDVFEEDQAEHDVLVLGRIHVVAQRIGGLPELGLETQPSLGISRPGAAVVGGLSARHGLPFSRFASYTSVVYGR